VRVGRIVAVVADSDQWPYAHRRGGDGFDGYTASSIFVTRDRINLDRGAVDAREPFPLGSMESSSSRFV
jgi:hypothetical protein